MEKYRPKYKVILLSDAGMTMVGFGLFTFKMHLQITWERNFAVLNSLKSIRLNIVQGFSQYLKVNTTLQH